MKRDWKSLCYHEAGHFVMNELLGIPIESVILLQSTSKSNVKSWTGRVISHETHCDDKHTRVAVAGPVADCIYFNQPDTEGLRVFTEYSPKRTLPNVRCNCPEPFQEICLRWEGDHFQCTALDIDVPWKDASRLLRENWNHVVEIAEAMQCFGSLKLHVGGTLCEAACEHSIASSSGLSKERWQWGPY